VQLSGKQDQIGHRVAHGQVSNQLIMNQSIILTGASGALGRGLAMHHASPGVSLCLWGRNPERLSDTCEAVRAVGAEAQQIIHDLSKAEAAILKLLDQDRVRPFDIAYLVAGLGDTRPPGEKAEDPMQVLRLAEVNFAAPAAMAAALAGRMAERGRGRIVLIGSAAGHHSLPFAAAYSGSKAGLARFADALRLSVEPYGVSVTLAAPGFIKTPAGSSINSNRPMEITVEEAVRRIVRAAEQRRAHYITPWPFAALKSFDALLPNWLRDRILRGLQK